MNYNTPGLPVHHQLPEFTQTHVHWVCDAIQSSHPLSSLSPPAFNLSQHQGLFKWILLQNLPLTQESHLTFLVLVNMISHSVQFSSVTQSCPTLCDPMNCSMPGLPVHHQILESTQTHVHWVGNVRGLRKRSNEITVWERTLWRIDLKEARQGMRRCVRVTIAENQGELVMAWTNLAALRIQEVERFMQCAAMKLKDACSLEEKLWPT